MTKTAKKAAAPKVMNKRGLLNEGKKAEPAKAAAPMKANQPANDPGKPFERAAGHHVIISGEGTMPLGADNWRRVPRGTSISVSADELAWLENSGVAFKRA